MFIQMLVLSMSVNTSVRRGIKVSVSLISQWNVHSESQKQEVKALSFLDAR